MPRRTILLLFITLILAACASSGTQGTRERRDRDHITRDEIARVQVGTAYEVVETLRPQYLRSRGMGSTTAPPEYAVVYIDGVRAGGLDQLRRVSRDSLEEIRYINGSDATTRFGTGHGGGAILVTTRR